jgi:iron complex outermembrane receptor protein
MPRSRRLKLAQIAILRKGLPVASSLIAASPVAFAQQSTSAGGLEEIIVTAQKREESLQNVPISVQAIDSTKLEQLQVKEFADYVKYMPSVAYTSLGPGFSLPYFRGVASGENNNHSGPQPSVGIYLDEQPITTIQGALDVHMYDIARVEALAGPQGTLYGASSQAGTIRIITNKPDPTGFSSGYGLEANSVEHGGMGYVAEGFVNLPISPAAAVRLVGWARHDAGYIDNVAAERRYPTTGACVSNRKNPPAGCVSGQARAKDDFNDVDTYGARAALRIDLNDNWTITPQVITQKQEANGAFFYDATLDELEVAHFFPDRSEDEFVQASLTIEGRVGNFDITYAGAFLDRSDTVDADYSDYTYWYDVYWGLVAYWNDSAGNPLADPSQFINGSDDYKRWSHELRISSPQDARVRFVGGLFYQDNEHEIFQRYKVQGLGGFFDGPTFVDLTIPGWPDTIWLTNQLRKDKDKAVFGELSFDFTEQLTATVGARYFETENSIRGFFGFGDPTGTYTENYGLFRCQFYEQPAKQYNRSPCQNINDSVDDSGNVFKGNLTYRFTPDKLVYATYSEGFRPGGINRNNTVAPYKPDYLTNYEIGWKTTWGNALRFNGAIFHEKWDDIQYSFLPPSGSGLTVIRNAGGAEIDGIEADLTWAAPVEGLTLSGGFSWLDAKLAEDYVPDPESPPEAFEGDRLPVVPEFKANLTARMQFDLGGRGAFAQAAAVYHSDTYSDLTRFDRSVTGKNPSYTLVDLSAGMSFGSLDVELFIGNVFDELGQNGAFVGCSSDTCFPEPYRTVAQPRTIGLKISQDF